MSTIILVNGKCPPTVKLRYRTETKTFKTVYMYVLIERRIETFTKDIYLFIDKCHLYTFLLGSREWTLDSRHWAVGSRHRGLESWEWAVDSWDFGSGE